MSDEAVQEQTEKVDAPAEEVKRDPKANIPGLELTWEQAEILGIDDAGVAQLQGLKTSNPQVQLSIVPTGRDYYVIRSCSRMEWRNFLNSMTDVNSKRDTLLEQGQDPQAVQTTISMLMEEKTVERMLVYPKLDIAQLRQLPPGEVNTLHEAIMIALGFNQQVMPIKI